MSHLPKTLSNSAVSALSREDELRAYFLLTNQEEIPGYMVEKRWRELHALACFVHEDAPMDLAGSSPAKYRTLRAQITEARIAGWMRLELAVLARLAGIPPLEAEQGR